MLVALYVRDVRLNFFSRNPSFVSYTITARCSNAALFKIEEGLQFIMGSQVTMVEYKF